MLDSGAELNLCTKALAALAGLDGTGTHLQLAVAGGSTTSVTKEKVVTFQLQAMKGSYISPVLQATTVKKITQDLREVPIDISKYPHLQNIEFTEEFPRQLVAVDLMIGLPDYNMLICTGQPIKGKRGEPMALPTKLGNVLTGEFQGTVNKF